LPWPPLWPCVEDELVVVVFDELCVDDLPFLWPLPWLFDVFFVCDVGHGPIVSPWCWCPFRDAWATVIVTNGCFFECVWWQIVTFVPYWYWDELLEVADQLEPARTPRAAMTPSANAVASRPRTRVLGPVPLLTGIDPLSLSLSSLPA